MYNAAPIFFLYPSPLMRHSVQVSDLSVVCTGRSIIFHFSQTNDDRIAKQKSNSFPPRSSFLNPRFSLQIHDNQIQHHPPPMASILLLFLVRECQFAQLQRQPLTPHSTQDISMMAILNLLYSYYKSQMFSLHHLDWWSANCCLWATSSRLF